MNAKAKRIQQKRLMAVLSGKNAGTLELSPNDVLVQIALPLILILAIIVQLLTVAQSVQSESDDGPILLDLWKQQLILRVDRMFTQWEEKSGITNFPDFSRINWKGEWPNDPRFQTLCKSSLELSDITKFGQLIYYDALNYDPQLNGEDEKSIQLFKELYDPEAPNAPATPGDIKKEFWIDDQRRAYANSYIAERILRWKEIVENLQWNTIGKIVVELPLDHELTDKNLAVQMDNIANALDNLGYPLLPSVIQEYDKNE